jgi:hypothetical protein
MFARIQRMAFAFIFAGTLLSTLAFGTANAGNSEPLSEQAPPSITYTASAVTEFLQSSTGAPTTSEYFGMHIHNLANPALRRAQQTPFPSFSFSTMRLWDNADWFVIEPERDTYNWTRMDGTIQKASANGVSDFIFTFGYVPQWASSNPDDPCGTGWMPGHCDAPDLADLDSFANHLVQRYCGVVKYYETWNEPSAKGYWVGTNEQFLAVTQHIYAAVKSPANCGCTEGKCSPGGGANPNKVLLPPINAPTSPSARQWLQNWLSYVGNPYPYADVAAFHGYGYTSDPENIRDGVNYMRSVLAQYGLGSLELWNTEASWGDGTLPDQGEQASWVIRYQLMQALSGVSRFTWYAYDNCLWGTLWEGSLCTPKSDAPRVHEAAVAYATVQHWLTGATLRSCEDHADGTWLCELTRADGYVAWAAWNSKGANITLNSSAMTGLVQFRDWQDQKSAILDSVEIGPMPILLENKDGFKTMKNPH